MFCPFFVRPTETPPRHGLYCPINGAPLVRLIIRRHARLIPPITFDSFILGSSLFVSQRVPKLADRHLVVVVGDLEVCRGGVPAPSPPTEGSSWAYDLWTKDTVSTAAAATANAAAGAVGAGPVVASGKGRSKRGSGEVCHYRRCACALASSCVCRIRRACCRDFLRGFV